MGGEIVRQDRSDAFTTGYPKLLPTPRTGELTHIIGGGRKTIKLNEIYRPYTGTEPHTEAHRPGMRGHSRHTTPCNTGNTQPIAYIPRLEDSTRT